MALQLQRSRGWVPASLMVLILLSGACGSGSDSAGPAPATAPSIPSGPSASSTTTTASRPEREYPGGGPTDPVFPPGDQAYALISAGTCAELLDDTKAWVGQDVPDVEGLDTVSLYTGAADACLGRWREAEDALGQIDTATPDFRNNRCEREAVLAWLVALVGEWKRDPTFSPVFVASASPSPCVTDDSTSTDPGSATTTPAG